MTDSLARDIARLEAALAGKVSKEVHDRDMREIKEDISEIKQSQTRSQQIITAALVAVITQIVIQLLGRIGG